MSPHDDIWTAADDVATVRRVLLKESEALQIMAEQQTDTISHILDLLTVKDFGRVIVSGIGKSGHVARKIAATMASIGTPSIYVHPSEASHGDLGMITQNDVIFALSNSGETQELTDIVQYSRRFAIPLIVMTSRSDSTLAKASDISLILPKIDEACSIGLTPTTSTTLMMALGDALAITLLERKGFSSDDFKIFHPGGKLGRKLLKVADIMHSGDSIPLVISTMLMGQVLLVMTNKSFGCVGVLDNSGRYLIGIITDGDLRRHMKPNLFKRTANEIMTINPRTVISGTLAVEVLHLMNVKSITSMFVVDEKYPIGIVHMHDCLRAGIV
ncbi:MAG: KpsF/GutQ family sugar-phosphate isomerase [Rhodospirillaceae bacterium]|jgi:arabinose-5-phosphate isomerase|nr:KpsF/GutQ family sugar-phosphate isomerase [Rhodospirillaceae bacterium]